MHKEYPAQKNQCTGPSHLLARPHAHRPNLAHLAIPLRGQIRAESVGALIQLDCLVVNLSQAVDCHVDTVRSVRFGVRFARSGSLFRRVSSLRAVERCGEGRL